MVVILLYFLIWYLYALYTYDNHVIMEIKPKLSNIQLCLGFPEAIWHTQGCSIVRKDTNLKPQGSILQHTQKCHQSNVSRQRLCMLDIQFKINICCQKDCPRCRKADTCLSSADVRCIFQLSILCPYMSRRVITGGIGKCAMLLLEYYKIYCRPVLWGVFVLGKPETLTLCVKQSINSTLIRWKSCTDEISKCVIVTL